MSESVHMRGHGNQVGFAIETRWRKAPSCADQPEGRMTLWSFIEFAYGDIVLLGTLAATGRARVTTAIVGIDAHRRTVTTTSGRRYHLVGPPGLSAASMLALLALAAESGCGRDITQALCAANALEAR